MSDVGTAREQSLRERVAEEIRALMARRNISRQTMAKAMGVSHTTVWRRLSGDTALDLDELERIADTLGVHLVDLFPRRDTTIYATPVGAVAQQERVDVRATLRKAASPERTGRTGYPGHSSPGSSTRRPGGTSFATRKLQPERTISASAA